MSRRAVKGDDPLTYHITTSPDGTVRLSKSWHWQNEPMASEVEAEAYAERDAGGQAFVIKRKAVRF